MKKIELKPGFYRSLRFSPDSKKVALVDSFQRLWYVDLDSKKQIEVDQDTYQMRSGDIAGAWSPDSKWLAYSKVLPNELSAIHLFSLSGGKSTQVTDGMSDADNPVFDKDGKYLYFTASTNSGESLGLDIHAVGRTATSSIYLAVLDKSQPSPFAPESDEEKAADEKKPDDAEVRCRDKPKAEQRRSVTRSTSTVSTSAFCPCPCRRGATRRCRSERRERCSRWSSCRRRRRPGSERPSGARNIVGPPLRSENPQERRAARRSSKLPDVVRRREGAVPAGRRLDYRGPAADAERSRGWSRARRLRRPERPAPTPLKTGSIEVRVDPIQEWKQMYREAWRIERDWFYDRNIHGLDLKAAEKKYEPYLRGVASRSDLTYLFQEMLGNITVSHMGTGGGDLPK